MKLPKCVLLCNFSARKPHNDVWCVSLCLFEFGKQPNSSLITSSIRKKKQKHELRPECTVWGKEILVVQGDPMKETPDLYGLIDATAISVKVRYAAV